MKTVKILAGILAAGLAVASCGGQTPAIVGENGETLKDFMPSKAEVDSVSYLVGINFGSFIKGYNFGDDLNYSKIVEGIKDFVAAKGDYRDADFAKQFKIDPETMNDAFNAFLEKRQNYTNLESKAKEQEYLAANAKKAGVQVTESGLQYEILEPGNDLHAGPVDTVWVHYKGSLTDGTVFDQTEEGTEPIHFSLNQVIPGWTEGIQLVGEGGKIKLTIPSELGYGSQGNQAIPANSTLLFDVEVVKVSKATAPAAE